MKWIFRRSKISDRELREIRWALEAVPGRYDSGEVIHVAIALPDPCSDATRGFAEELIERLRSVQCVAGISLALSFPAGSGSSRRYEVLPEMPLGRPVVRIF